MNHTRRWMFAAAALAAGLAACRTMVRPRALRWGATQDEVARPMPADPIVRKADFVATRAITIDVAPGQVWPWLVQVGNGRAGSDLRQSVGVVIGQRARGARCAGRG